MQKLNNSFIQRNIEFPKDRRDIFNNETICNCVDLFFEMKFLFSDLENLLTKNFHVDTTDFSILFFLFHNASVLTLRQLRDLTGVKNHKNIQYKIMKLKEMGLIFAKDEEEIELKGKLMNLKCEKFREVYDLTTYGFETLAKCMLVIVDTFQDLSNKNIEDMRMKVQKMFVPVKIDYLLEEK